MLASLVAFCGQFVSGEGLVKQFRWASKDLLFEDFALAIQRKTHTHTQEMLISSQSTAHLGLILLAAKANQLTNKLLLKSRR